MEVRDRDTQCVSSNNRCNSCSGSNDRLGSRRSVVVVE